MFNLNPTLINQSEEIQFLLNEKCAMLGANTKCGICKKHVQGKVRIHFIGDNFGFNLKPGMYATHDTCEAKAKELAYKQDQDLYYVLSAVFAVGDTKPI